MVEQCWGILMEEQYRDIHLMGHCCEVLIKVCVVRVLSSVVVF